MTDEILVFDHVNGTVKKATLQSIPWAETHTLADPQRYEALRAAASSVINDLCYIAEQLQGGSDETAAEAIWQQTERLEKAMGPF